MVCDAVQVTRVVPMGNMAPFSEDGEPGFTANTGEVTKVSVAPAVVDVALNPVPDTV